MDSTKKETRKDGRNRNHVAEALLAGRPAFVCIKAAHRF